MGNEIAKRRMAAIEKAGSLDDLIQAGVEAFIASSKGSMADTLSLAVAVVEIENALGPEIMKPLMSLQGKAIGFKTDKTYPESVVKQVAVEMLIKGLPMANNCVNIISGNGYVPKEGFTYLINKLAAEGSIKNFQYTLDVPKSSGGKTIVHGKANWVQDGERQELEADFPIKTNGGSTDDNTLGKAERKLKARCHERMTGLVISDGDTDSVPLHASVVEVSDSPLDDLDSPPAAPVELPENTDDAIGVLRRKNAKEFPEICSSLGVNPAKWNTEATEEQKGKLLESLKAL